MIVADREHALVVEPVAGQVSWAWLLNALDADTTRLISRVRMRLGFKPLLLAFAPAIELPWFLMERGMLHGIKRRAERLAQAGTPARHEHRQLRGRTPVASGATFPESAHWRTPGTAAA